MNGWLRPLRRARLSVLCWITCALLPLLGTTPANAATAHGPVIPANRARDVNGESANAK